MPEIRCKERLCSRLIRCSLRDAAYRVAAAASAEPHPGFRFGEGAGLAPKAQE